MTVAIVFFGLAVTGQTINLMTLGGIAAAIGLVADDAIVVVENIARHAEERVSDNPARSGLAEVLPGLTGSSLSTIVIFFPFALLSGVSGAFFRPLALTMALALAVSYVLSATAVPLAAERLRVGARPRKARARRRAPRIARFVIAHPSIALARDRRPSRRRRSPLFGDRLGLSARRWTRVRSSWTTGRRRGLP